MGDLGRQRGADRRVPSEKVSLLRLTPGNLTSRVQRDPGRVCAKASEKLVLKVAGHEVQSPIGEVGGVVKPQIPSRSVVTSARLIVEYLLEELDKNIRVLDQNRLRL